MRHVTKHGPLGDGDIAKSVATAAQLTCRFGSYYALRAGVHRPGMIAPRAARVLEEDGGSGMVVRTMLGCMYGL